MKIASLIVNILGLCMLGLAAVSIMGALFMFDDRGVDNKLLVAAFYLWLAWPVFCLVTQVVAWVKWKGAEYPLAMAIALSPLLWAGLTIGVMMLSRR
jgi:hypothetical protein